MDSRYARKKGLSYLQLYNYLPTDCSITVSSTVGKRNRRSVVERKVIAVQKPEVFQQQGMRAGLVVEGPNFHQHIHAFRLRHLLGSEQSYQTCMQAWASNCGAVLKDTQPKLAAWHAESFPVLAEVAIERDGPVDPVEEHLCWAHFRLTQAGWAKTQAVSAKKEESMHILPYSILPYSHSHSVFGLILFLIVSFSGLQVGLPPLFRRQ